MKLGKKETVRIIDDGAMELVISVAMFGIKKCNIIDLIRCKWNLECNVLVTVDTVYIILYRVLNYCSSLEIFPQVNGHF